MLELGKLTTALYEDETLRSNMDVEAVGIWFYAADAYLRCVARRKGDLEKAFRVARFGLRAVNVAIAEQAALEQGISLAEELDRR